MQYIDGPVSLPDKCSLASAGMELDKLKRQDLASDKSVNGILKPVQQTKKGIGVVSTSAFKLSVILRHIFEMA